MRNFDGCRLRSCVGHFDAADVTTGLDEVRTLGLNQTAPLYTTPKVKVYHGFLPAKRVNPILLVLTLRGLIRLTQRLIQPV